MAASRQRQTEDRSTASLDERSKFARTAPNERGRSPINSHRAQLQQPTTRHHNSSPGFRIRRASPLGDEQKARIPQRYRSPSPARKRDDDSYRPTRKREAERKRSTSPLRKPRPTSRNSRDRRARSKSSARTSQRNRVSEISSRPDWGTHRDKPSRREDDKGYPIKSSRDHHARRSPSPRRQVPDSYAFQERRRPSRSPLSTYQQPASKRRQRSPSPPRYDRHHRDSSIPRQRPDLSDRAIRSESSFNHASYRDRRSERPSRDAYPQRRSASPHRRRRSPSPANNYSRREDTRKHKRDRSRDIRAERGANINRREGSASGEDMRGSYPGHGMRGGLQRPPPLHPEYGHSPPYAMQHFSPPPQHSPYGHPRPGWVAGPPVAPVQSPQFGSHYG